MASGLRGILASLSIKLSADSAELDRDLEKAKKSTRDWAGETTAAAKNVGAAFGAAAVASAAALTAMAAKSLETMDQNDEMAKGIGISVEQLTRLQYAAKMSGADQAVLNKALKDTAKTTSEVAAGLGKNVGIYNELGLNAEKLNQIKPDQQFLLLADALQNVTNANDRTRIATKLFGDEGLALVNVLSQGQEGLRALAAESDAAGFTVTQNQADLAAAAGDAKDKMSLAWEGVSNQLATQLGPAITNVGNLIAEYLPDSIDLARAGFYGLRLVVSTLFDTITTVVGSVAGAITSAILTPIEKVTQGLAFALDVLGSDGAADVQAMANKLTAARETADDYALSFMRIGDVYAENKKTYDAAIDSMVQEKAARQAQLDATKASTLAVADFTGVNQTKAESDKAAADAAKAVADAEKERAKALKLVLDESAKLMENDGEEAIRRARDAQDAILNGARGALSGVGAHDGAGEDPLAIAQSQFTGQQEALRWMLEQEQITRDEFYLLSQETERNHQLTMTEILAQEVAQRAQIESMSFAQRAQLATTWLTQMTAGLANHSRKFFELNKAAAIGNALLNTEEAMTSAYKHGTAIGGPVMGNIFKGIAFVSQMAQVNAIKNTKFGGGTTPSLAGSTPTYNNVPVTNGNSQNTGNTEGAGGMKIEMALTVVGSDPAAVANEVAKQLEDKATTRSIITNIATLAKEEDLEVVPPASRNGMDLARAS